MTDPKTDSSAVPYDAVIVGSGLGGLTCGAFLAREGMRVLVLEQHTQTGGYAHSFRRKGYRFESGVHSVPIGPDGMIMHLLRLLGAEKSVEIIPVNGLYSVRCGEFSYAVPAAPGDILHRLHEDFPRQRANLDRFIADAARMFDAMMRPVYSFEHNLTEENREFASKYIGKTYKQYVDSFFDDEDLRYILYSQWPYSATPPELAPVIFYTFMFYVHQLEGSHGCKGGYRSIADALSGAITARGGSVRTGCRVTALRTEKGAVRDVVLSTGETVRARLVVSNISPYQLHRTLIDPAAGNRIWLRRLGNLKPSPSCIAVYCGLKDNAPCLPESCVTFWYRDRDNATIYRNVMEGRAGEDDHLLLLQGMDEGPRTMMLMKLASISAEQDWKNAKMRHAENMLARFDRLYPGVRDNIEFMEVGSPSTFERYTGNTDGAIYGFENISDLYSEAKLPFKTYLNNLYQVGHWGKPGGGVWNVMVNGYTVSKFILRDFA